MVLLLRRQDSNMRPPGYEPGELPTAPLRGFNFASAKVVIFTETAKLFADFFARKRHKDEKMFFFCISCVKICESQINLLFLHMY